MRRIEEIAEREAKATKGPWCCVPAKKESTDFLIGPGEKYTGKDVGHVGHDDWDDPYPAYAEADADFIAHSREDIPYLLNLIREMKAKAVTVHTGECEDWWCCPGCQVHVEVKWVTYPGNTMFTPQTPDPFPHAPGCVFA